MKRDGSRVFHVSAVEADLTLLDALRLWLPEPLAADARRLVSERRVQIDGNLCLDHKRCLKSREVVKVLPHSVIAPPTEADIRIQFVDDYIVVVEKPSGMTTMRHEEEAHWSARRQRREATLDDLLPRVLARMFASKMSGKALAAGRREQPAANALRKTPSHTARSGGKSADAQSLDTRRFSIIPVHRLDRETSGLMVFARTVAAEHSLVEQFREHSIERAYWAIVLGDIAEQTIESHLVRDRGDGKRGSTSLPETGQRAVTHVRSLERLRGHTLIECRLETGRTHQIRIHLSEAGHPLCGDTDYRGPLNARPIPDRSGAPRLALHAAELSFKHPVTGERLHFEMRLPRELADFVTFLECGDASPLSLAAEPLSRQSNQTHNSTKHDSTKEKRIRRKGKR